eukprot:Tamp_16999.p3 GENE.Tamp_16999~~Tamp_16999.p3  ORF type:complete len:145 (+),score=24.74 Tamp_16999:381-815(+)
MKTTVALLAAMLATASAFAPGALPGSMALRSSKSAATSLKMGDFEITDGTPYKLSTAPVGAFGFAGWVVPTILVPSNIPLYGGKGLTVAFVESMTTQLQNFPAPPGPTDPFWLLCFLWHSGLFAVMMFGSIGWNMNPKLGGKQM